MILHINQEGFVYILKLEDKKREETGRMNNKRKNKQWRVKSTLIALKVIQIKTLKAAGKKKWTTSRFKWFHKKIR